MFAYRLPLVAVSLWLALVPALAADADAPAPQRLVIVLAGDTGLNESQQSVSPAGAFKHGHLVGWHEATRSIRPLLAGDIVFGNLETVVTDRNSLHAVPKAFNFRMHPVGLKHLIEAGFNLFSTANNHSMDYGVDGARDTVRFLDGMKEHGLLAHAGLGSDYGAASRPSLFERNGVRVAFSAIGITGIRAGASSPGPASWSSGGDFSDVVGKLTDAVADFRILSIHQGIELDPSTSQQQISRFRNEAALDGGIDLVVGHHQHVAAGVEMVGGKLIFHGLGNFLHLGTQDMSRFASSCRDFGLVARVHVVKHADRAPVIVAVEAIPVLGMHQQTRRADAATSRLRVAALNALSARLDDDQSGARGLRFTPQADGTGLYCTSAAESDNSEIGMACKALAERLSEDLPRADAGCGRSVAPEPRVAQMRTQAEQPSRPRPRLSGGAPLSAMFD